LAKFRLIIDYSHNRLYAVPNASAVKTPIEKDRIGMILGKKDSNFGVAFVSPNSPFEAAGFRKGDKIALIDGKPFDDWAPPALVRFHMAQAGTTHTFTMADGTVRQGQGGGLLLTNSLRAATCHLFRGNAEVPGTIKSGGSR
jgi:C-terminal processing protease CtpA/Prc